MHERARGAAARARALCMISHTAADCMLSVAVSGERSAPISPLAEQRGWELSNDQ
eukprot:COSAG02_NODE_29516_length_567_cov_83.801282_1_plen_54_part_10